MYIYIYMYIIKIKSVALQDRLKWLLPDGSTGGFVVSKALIPQP